MFCATTDTIQSISEKTKLLAQKCSQQILQSPKCVSAPNDDIVKAYSNDDDVVENNNKNMTILDLASAGNGGQQFDQTGTQDANFKEKCLCACKGTIGRIMGKKVVAKERTTKWYIKPTWRLWGEEKEESDAIYTVYLKKVRYHRPITNGKESDGEDDISHLEWETVRVRFVKAAKLSKLVEALASDDGELESTFINVFLATYRTFTQPAKVLELLLQRYERLSTEKIHADASVSEQHKKTLVSALHVWLDGYPEDWDADNLQNLLAFTSKRLPNTELHLKALTRYTDRFDKFSRVPPPLPWSPDYYEYHEIAEQFNGMCLSPAFRGPPSHLLNSYRFPNIPVKHFAEQLTRMDMELFKRLIPHQCLGSTWSRRDKNECASVLATVNQFNAVSFRVISTILIEPRLKPSERALLISTWIDIAQELRMLKNFSSLKAIISGLQSHPVYRLSKTWAALCREKLELFNELARIFSEENNAWTQREVLMREGTAKFADVVGENDKQLQKVFQKQNTLISHGTIPYLGTFLTDLTYIHAAIPDTIGDGLINFDKKRKEFEILAQIKLLQGAANSYHLPEDPLFDRWFASLLILDEREAHTLSCQLEVPTEPRKLHNGVNAGHRKTDSITSNSSSGAGSHFYCDINNSSLSSRNNSLDRDVTPPNASIMSAASSVSSLSMESNTSSSDKKSNTPKTPNSKNQSANGHGSNLSTPNGKNSSVTDYPIINGQLVQNSPIKNGTPDFYIIKITYESDHPETLGVVMYKSIMLGNNERTPQVIRNAMMKLGLEGDPDQYSLSQVLPDKELLMPYNANVYYAVNTAYNLNFILRKKKEET
ncbi:ral guanine nucleotide dissociation stimulator-like 1 isoform X2 [Culicoides brevitarsis]|uniref:ral guanine nucleotide dissociation stimulator-like 1 isoform X2 n=1 Tax=Culicoides brevitarsis TaxID=469753 RepID=UPI00307B988A